MPKFSEIDQKTPEQIEKLKQFSQNPRGFLLLAGTNGTGKSFAAESIYEMHTPYRLPHYDKDLAYFVTQSNLNTQWLEEKREGSGLNILHCMKATKLLVIDDLGTRTPSEAFVDFLYDLFDHRWRNKDKLGTIITTNLSAEKIRLMFGDAIVSRVASGICMRFIGDDRRYINF